MQTTERITKDFSIFDCDAHIMDRIADWLRYVPESKQELIRQTLWFDDATGLSFLNGDTPVYATDHRLRYRTTGGEERTSQQVDARRLSGGYPHNTIKGPQVDTKIVHKLVTSMLPLDPEQWDYLDHEGAYDAHARVNDLDMMGIDQVLIVPTTLIMNLMGVERDDGAAVVCEAYNQWLRDWCDEVPDRLFGAAILPQFSAEHAAAEVFRVAELGHPLALIRPIDVRGRYPNASASMDAVYRAFEETGVCLGVHTFPAQMRAPSEAAHFISPNEYLATPSGRQYADLSPLTLGFVYEAQTWLAQVLLSGFLDRYPRLKMVVFESNSQWLPYLLEQCDRLFKLYRNERKVAAERLPSQAFADQCAISFESDEVPTQRQWRAFEDVGVWASDMYHHDAADAWSVLRSMRELDVPQDVQEKLLGGTARRLYGIEPKLFVTEEPPPVARPPWYPEAGPEFDEWTRMVSHPREHAVALRERGW